MLTKEFLMVTFLATLVAIPLAWYSADRWLSGFAYRIDMPWWIYAATFSGIGFVTISIICLQGLKTVVTNPTQTLRSE